MKRSGLRNLNCSGFFGRTIAPLLVCLALLSCSAYFPEPSPQVTIQFPASGTVLSPGRVEFAGLVAEPSGQNINDLEVSWAVSVNQNTEVCTSQPSDSGQVRCSMYLKTGIYRITLMALNKTGWVSEATSSVEVVNGAPEIALDPLETTLYSLDSPVILIGSVSDLETPQNLLTVVWTSDQDGLLGTTSADKQGGVWIRIGVLTPGVHVITATVFDEERLSSTEEVELTVETCLDHDRDGYSTCQSSTLTADCDDSNEFIYPGAEEICNYLDDNCDGEADETLQIQLYPDEDADGFGTVSEYAMTRCEWEWGYSIDNSDCNDLDPNVSPESVEVCNGYDDDCDDEIDEDTMFLWHYDNDQDGYGTALGSSTLACVVPLGYSGNAMDCNDNNALIYPSAVESCNGYDDDCDLQIDEGVTTPYYTDRDGDGYGAMSDSGASACNQPPGYVDNSSDCNDINSQIRPDAAEACNGYDDNCDNMIDDLYITWYLDSDNDLYGSNDPDAWIVASACNVQDGYVTNNYDCDDEEPLVNPKAVEIPGSEVDEDCDGWEVCFVDADGDFFRPDSVSTVASPNIDCEDEGEASNSLSSGDCNDEEAGVFPGQDELCDGVDQDCDNLIDEGCPDLPSRP